MTSVEDLRRTIQTAELAVADIDDQDLRRIAFDRVLQHLLLTQGGHHAAGASVALVARQPSARGSPAKQVDGPSAWVADLQREEFFKSPKTITDVVQAVKAAGHNILSKDVTYPLEQMARKEILRREKEVTAESKRKVWVYRKY
jgi:hypothetical protein